jgi:hypothetical protein
MKSAVLDYLDVVGDSAYGRPMDNPKATDKRKAMDVRNDDDMIVSSSWLRQYHHHSKRFVPLTQGKVVDPSVALFLL